MAETYGIGERTDPDDKSTFVPGQGYTKAEVLKLITIRYAMKANSYQKYIPTTIATDVSEKTVAAVKENNDALLGIDIAEDTIRRYINGTYFSHIIGYTGKISSDELKSLNEETSRGEDEPDRYEMNDTVGKSGIEKVMETYLQGEKGSETIYVDNLGKEIDSEGRWIRSPEMMFTSLWMRICRKLCIISWNRASQACSLIRLKISRNSSWGQPKGLHN